MFWKEKLKSQQAHHDDEMSKVRDEVSAMKVAANEAAKSMEVELGKVKGQRQIKNICRVSNSESRWE